MQRLLLLGLNHTTAPLEVRERVAFDLPSQRQVIEELRSRYPESEFVLLCTCNRVEFYAARQVHGHPRAEELIADIAAARDLPIDAIRPHLYEKSERDAIEHLFHVASALDSMVLGESQILGQVRTAYEAASAIGGTGAMLNPLFQRAIAVGRQVLRETALGEGRLSVASVAVEYARQIFDRFADKTVLSIGAGKMSQLVLRHFAELAPKNLLVCNRTVDRAQTLAARFGTLAVEFDRLPDHLAQADIVVTSTGASQPIISRAMMEGVLKQRRYRPIVLIDIALPRDVESSVADLESVYLYNLDDLQSVVQQTQGNRRDAVEAARAIVRKHVEEFFAWNRARELGPAIERLYAHHHHLAQEELHRTLNKLPNISEAEKDHLEELARRIVNKLLHEPIRTLREAGNTHGSVSQYLHAMEKLFKLSAPSDEDPGEK